MAKTDSEETSKKFKAKTKIYYSGSQMNSDAPNSEQQVNRSFSRSRIPWEKKCHADVTLKEIKIRSMVPKAENKPESRNAMKRYLAELEINC